MLVKNLKASAGKEASHFLRNVGYWTWQSSTSTSSGSCTTTSLSRICQRLDQARYEAHEQLLIPVVQKLHMDLGEMDLYLWYAVKNTVDK